MRDGRPLESPVFTGTCEAFPKRWTPVLCISMFPSHGVRIASRFSAASMA
jgi:hypothetical protein